MQSNEQQRVLIVDDEPFNVRVLVDLLRPSYRLQVARDGAQALALTAEDPLPRRSGARADSLPGGTAVRGPPVWARRNSPLSGRPPAAGARGKPHSGRRAGAPRTRSCTDQ